MTRFKPFALAGALFVVTACSLPSSAQSVRLGTIDFPTSGAADAKPHFIRGVLFLHSFEYGAAADEFRKAQKANPDFAMAYWGEAMTQTHPVWNEQDVAAARLILSRLARTPQERLSKAPTSREKKYLEAIETLYGDGSKARRDTLYSASMKRIVDAHPEDMEAKAFYALSLIGLSQGVRNVSTYERAGRIAETIFKQNPDHPGAAHYIIHAYDDPTHAQQGLTAARAYSKIAPGAAHAQHMTTHIFLAMGMWDEVVSQNEIASGHDHDAWTPNHYTSWLNYAYLQQGRYADALHMLEKMMPSARRRVEGRQLWALLSMRARYLIDTEEWDSPIATGSVDISGLGVSARGYWSFVNGLRALRKRDTATAAKELSTLVQANLLSSSTVDPNIILEKELTALVRLAEGKRDEALELMRDAARREDSMAVEFGPPAILKPTHELLGEILLEIGRPKDAHSEFKRALELAPMRSRSLLGLARAAMAMGDSAGAARSYADLRRVWHRADPKVRNLAELRAFTGS
ncbi:MAG TPA: tetratricopeptide repeat protein [Gemmatimonadaceae bacterium]|nr:tetratricopeptide repeat protein [Gemmatimonadaceae bacterium]